MSIFDWTEDGQTVTEEWLASKGFVRCRVFTTRVVTWYQYYVSNNSFGITVNLDLNRVNYRTEEGTHWVCVNIGDTQQIELLLSQLKNRI